MGCATVEANVEMSPNLRGLRYNRTRASNVAKRTIVWMLTEPAKWGISGRPIEEVPEELPSWWPFWSDVLKQNVIVAVREARALHQAESLDACKS